MKLLLKRHKSIRTCTHGDLYVDGKLECYTLEDVVREEKIAGKTAIPAGTYLMTISYSPRFRRELPLILNVPNFTGVRIHMGNTSADTEGCILVGRERPNEDADFISRSLIAFKQLFQRLNAAEKLGEKLELTIQDAV